MKLSIIVLFLASTGSLLAEIPPPAPDVGPTAGLLTLALAALVLARRYLHR